MSFSINFVDEDYSDDIAQDISLWLEGFQKNV
jgi:hypothetical protein